MKSSRILIACLTGLVLLTGCASPQPAPQPVVQPEPVNQEVLKALTELSEIKQELKKLRNSVEELQFESENAKRRQQDLYQDLDRRMVDIERNQSTLSSAGSADAAVDTDTGQGGVTVVGDTVTQSGQSGETTGSATTTDSGTADQVIVVSSNNQSTSPDQGQVGAVVTTSDSVTLEEQEAYEQAFELLKQSRYEDAVAGFQQFTDTWPNSQLADDAFYWMSEARYVNREFEYALSGFRTVVSRYPDSQRVPEALLKIGYIQYDIGSYEDAAETFRDILDRFPGHQVTVSAQTRLRRIEQTIQ